MAGYRTGQTGRTGTKVNPASLRKGVSILPDTFRTEIDELDCEEAVQEKGYFETTGIPETTDAEFGGDFMPELNDRLHSHRNDGPLFDLAHASLENFSVIAQRHVVDDHDSDPFDAAMCTAELVKIIRATLVPFKRDAAYLAVIGTLATFELENEQSTR